MKPPCVVTVQYILPALRVAISKELINTYKMRKAEVAAKMDLTPAAITQYLKRSRGDAASAAIERSGRVKELIYDISRDIAEGVSPPDLLLMKLCRICRAARDEGLICEAHMEMMPSLRGIETCACSWGPIR
ncbi:transcriptional regulator [Candidatus Bathyarchaeota archaeon]|nr:transcriptional regulator [Candidatus Bathyarchaeota archaeon]